jgi:phenylalanyl-tRNA synthetase beta chain
MTPVLFELALDAVQARDVPALRPMSKFQAVERDLAFIVAQDVTHAALMRAIQAAPTAGLLRDAVLFDVYRAKPGQVAAGLTDNEKSLAVRLTFSDMEATLTDEQVDAAVQSVLASLQQQVGARLRA